MSRIARSIAAFLIAVAAGACGGGGDSTAAEPATENAAADARQQLSLQAVEEVAPEPPLMQVGPWSPAPYNIEEPFIDLIHGDRLPWDAAGISTDVLVESEVIDGETLLPTRLPDGKWLWGGLYFPGNSAAMALHWDGDWVLEWEGDADFWMEFLPREYQWREDNRIVFTRDYKRGKTPDHTRVQLRRLDGPLKSLRLYRAENEAALKAGKIYNPKFVDAVSRYDIVRTMDLQSAYGAVIRSVDDLATMATPYWGNADWGNGFSNFVQGMPIEAVFRLGVEADVDIWMQAPMTLGAPAPLFDFRPDDGRRDVWAHRFGEAAGAEAEAVIESAEWDRYADAFVEALIASGYPADRPLYVSLANEVWNFAGAYFLMTKYAERMGAGLESYLPIDGVGMREAYGALVARFKLAVDGALARAGRAQDITYVFEGQAANPWFTMAALKGARAYLDLKDETWENHAPGFGVSVASYWGWANPADYGVDPDDLAALEDWLLNGPAAHPGTKANVLKLFRQHAAEAEKYGVPFIGAYEGGPHFTRHWRDPDGDGKREYFMTKENFEAFIWGTRGGHVNYEINKALAEEFPGIILSNYALAGPTGGQPWFEGPIGADNPYAKSWDRLMDLYEAPAQD